MDGDQLIVALDRLANRAASSQLGSATNWQGADVQILSSPTLNQGNSEFYPEPRYVVTQHSRQLSWLFRVLRDVFADHLDGQNKIEFFGRLANMANRHLSRNQVTTAEALCLAVLHEAYAIAEEIEEVGQLESLFVAPGGMILDDFVDETEREAPLSAEAARQALLEMGIDLG